MKPHNNIKNKLISTVILTVFLLTQAVPGYALRQVSEAEAKGKAHGLVAELTSARAGGLTPQQRKEVEEEIRKHCFGWIKQAIVSLNNLDTSELINDQNRKDIFETFKEIPQYAGIYTYQAYDSLTALLESGVVTPDNQENVFETLKEIPQHAGEGTYKAYDSLTALLKSGAVTPDNQEKVFEVLKEIPAYAGEGTYKAYNFFKKLLKTIRQKGIPFEADVYEATLERIRAAKGEQVAKNIKILTDFFVHKVPDAKSGQPASFKLAGLEVALASAPVVLSPEAPASAAADGEGDRSSFESGTVLGLHPEPSLAEPIESRANAAAMAEGAGLGFRKDSLVKALFVCSYNRERSPLAAEILSAKLKENGLERKVSIDSCGIFETEPNTPALTANVIAKQVTEELISEATVIYVMEQAQKDELINNYSEKYPDIDGKIKFILGDSSDLMDIDAKDGYVALRKKLQNAIDPYIIGQVSQFVALAENPTESAMRGQPQEAPASAAAAKMVGDEIKLPWKNYFENYINTFLGEDSIFKSQFKERRFFVCQDRYFGNIGHQGALAEWLMFPRQNQTLVHLDQHADLKQGWISLLPFEELKEGLVHYSLHKWIGYILTYGNYAYSFPISGFIPPAIVYGIVDEIYWVVPTEWLSKIETKEELEERIHQNAGSGYYYAAVVEAEEVATGKVLYVGYFGEERIYEEGHVFAFQNFNYEGLNSMMRGFYRRTGEYRVRKVIHEKKIRVNIIRGIADLPDLTDRKQVLLDWDVDYNPRDPEDGVIFIRRSAEVLRDKINPQSVTRITYAPSFLLNEEKIPGIPEALESTYAEAVEMALTDNGFIDNITDQPLQTPLEFWRDKAAVVVAASEEGFEQARKQLKDRNVGEVIKIIITDEIDLRSLGGIAELKKIIGNETKDREVTLTIVNLDGISYDWQMIVENLKSMAVIEQSDVLDNDEKWQWVTDECA